MGSYALNFFIPRMMPGDPRDVCNLRKIKAEALEALKKYLVLQMNH